MKNIKYYSLQLLSIIAYSYVGLKLIIFPDITPMWCIRILGGLLILQGITYIQELHISYLNNSKVYTKWLTFYPKRDKQTPFKIKLDQWGYFDTRPQFSTNITSLLALILPFFSLWLIPLTIFFLFFGWGSIYLNIPYNTGKGDECESPSYGCNTYTNENIITEIWFYWGNKRKHISLPWALTWVRTSTLLENNNWFNETKNTRLNWNGEEYGTYNWLEANKKKEQYPFTDKYDNSTVNATISVVEREWRPILFKRLSLFTRKVKTIDVLFDLEAGEGKGTWKGGVLNCGYVMKKDETPLQCLKRMQKERKF